MRFKSKRALIALVAVLALGAIAASSASASVVWTKAGTVIKTGTKVGITTKIASGQGLTVKLPTAGIAIGCRSEKTPKADLLNAELKAGVLVGETTGTVELSECNFEGSGRCTVSQPAILEGSTSLALATVEGKEEIVSVFWPKGGGELTPAQIEKYEGERTGKAKEEQEKLHEYGVFDLTGSECAFKVMELAGDGVAAAVVADSEKPASSILDYSNVGEVTLQNGLKIGTKLKLWGVAATLVGESTLSFEEGTGALGVEKQ